LIKTPSFLFAGVLSKRAPPLPTLTAVRQAAGGRSPRLKIIYGDFLVI